jgi:hypothetical protein
LSSAQKTHNKLAWSLSAKKEKTSAKSLFAECYYFAKFCFSRRLKACLLSAPRIALGKQSILDFRK